MSHEPDLAAALYASQRDRYDLDNKIERLLTALFPSWSKWEFIAPDGIAVFQAIDSARGAEMLHRHGFKSVTLHGHRAQRFLTCTCVPREV